MGAQTPRASIGAPGVIAPVGFRAGACRRRLMQYGRSQERVALVRELALRELAQVLLEQASRFTDQPDPQRHPRLAYQVVLDRAV